MNASLTLVLAAFVAFVSCRDTVVSTSGYITDERYNPQYAQSRNIATLDTNGVTWTTKGFVRQARGGPAYGVFNDGQMIVAGGRLAGGSNPATTLSAETYRLGVDSRVTASAIAPLPSNTDTAETIGAVAGDKFFVLTSKLGANNYSQISIYNRLSNTWTTLGNALPNAHGTGAAAIFDQYIYFFDGRGSNGAVTRFNTDTFKSTTVATRPSPVGPNTADGGIIGSAAVRLGEYIYVIGGAIPFVPAVTTVFRFDPRNNTFTQIAGLNIARQGMGITAANNGIIIVGGTLQKSQEVFFASTGNWSRINSQVYPDSVYGLAGEGLFSVPSLPRTRVYIQQFVSAQGENCNTLSGSSYTVPLNQCFTLNSTYRAKIVSSESYSQFSMTIHKSKTCGDAPSRTQLIQSNSCTKIMGFNFVLSFHA